MNSEPSIASNPHQRGVGSGKSSTMKSQPAAAAPPPPKQDSTSSSLYPPLMSKLPSSSSSNNTKKSSSGVSSPRVTMLMQHNQSHSGGGYSGGGSLKGPPSSSLKSGSGVKRFDKFKFNNGSNTSFSNRSLQNNNNVKTTGMVKDGNVEVSLQEGAVAIPPMMIKTLPYFMKLCFISTCILASCLCFLASITINMFDLHGIHRWPDRYKLHGWKYRELVALREEFGIRDVYLPHHNLDDEEDIGDLSTSDASSSGSGSSSGSTVPSSLDILQDRDTVVLIPGLDGCTSFFANGIVCVVIL
jgi:hypothetical protein